MAYKPTFDVSFRLASLSSHFQLLYKVFFTKGYEVTRIEVPYVLQSGGHQMLKIRQVCYRPTVDTRPAKAVKSYFRVKNMNDIQIEEANPDDAGDVASMIGRLLGEIMQSIGAKVFGYDACESAKLLRGFLRSERYTAFIARDGDARVVGVITLAEGCALYAGGLLGTVPEFYVEPMWRSRGVGTALAEAARSHARARGWKRLEVTTPPLPQFERTLAFYERQGFAVTGGRKLKLEV